MGGVVSSVVDTVKDVVSNPVVDAAALAFATDGGSLFADMSMPSLGQVGSAMQIAGGINSLTGGGITNALGGKSTVQQATAAADPMAPYRANMAAMYAGALQPGATQDPTKMPGYSQFESGVLNPALEASKRSGAASGMMRSGNEQIALEKTAQQGYSGFMTDYLNRLAAGAGVAQSPAAGAAAGQTAQGNIMQGVGAIGTGIAGIFGGGSNVNTSGAGGGITSSGMQVGGYQDIYDTSGGTVPLGYANF
jgi:hypothetical protein